MQSNVFSATLSGSTAYLLLQLLVGAALFSGLFESVNASRVGPEVNTSAGRLSGSWQTTRYARNVAAFEGVPYAKPPVGELRFQPPQPAAAWSGVRAAQKPGAACLQQNKFSSSKAVQGSEDCLYLNVYAPETVVRTVPVPVMVYIHGGAFTSGSGDAYGPQYLLDHDVVLVTLNYRLGPLGFFTTGDGVIGANNGMKDQVQALRWVRDNIRNFGGDPGRVTIFGQSAGGSSVDLLTVSPLSKGLFHRAIAQSGSSLSHSHVTNSRSLVTARARKMAQLLNCTSSSQQLRKCLAAKTGAEIVSTGSSFLEWLVFPMVPFPIVVEPAGPGAFLDQMPGHVYAAGRAHDVPFMTGFVAQEAGVIAARITQSPSITKELNQRFTELAPVIMSTQHYPEQVNKRWYGKLRKFYFGSDGVITNQSAVNLTNFISDGNYLAPAVHTVKLRAAWANRTSPVFLYEMEYLSNRSSCASAHGMCHTDDLLHLFPVNAARLPPSKRDEEFSKTLIELFVRFATTGRPTKDGSWREVHHPDKAEYLHITGASAAGGLTMKRDFAPRRMAVWADQQAAA